MLLARRQAVLDQVAAEHRFRGPSAQTRTLAVDLAQPGASAAIAEATGDLEIGFLVYCAGADPNFEPFLANPIDAAEAMVQRNCVVPMQLCHHFAPGDGRARQRRHRHLRLRRRVWPADRTWSPTAPAKAFDMVFAEALWAELHDKGVDVLGLILGKTDTPALRRLEHSRGQIGSQDDVPTGRRRVADVIAEAFENLTNGPTWFVGEQHARRRRDDGFADPQSDRLVHGAGGCGSDG